MGGIWLQLTHRASTQRWVVFDEDGEPSKVVHFPRGGMVTHVSSQHIGVRVNEGIFALYEPVD